MRSGRSRNLLVLASALLLHIDPLVRVGARHYSMGTMFDIVVYHERQAEAEAAVARAVAEIVRLDRVLSHFRADSDLSALVREAKGRFVAVEPSLYDAIERSLEFSRRSEGKFDITVAPVLKAWTRAYAQGRRPADAELAAARRCVGHDMIELRAPDLIRLRSDCLELDLGGIGKGYAVDAALNVLRSTGIRHATVNAGGSSIAAIGAPPGMTGWPVRVGAAASGRIVLLTNLSIATSRQELRPLLFDRGAFGEIIDPALAAPVRRTLSTSVVAPSAIAADALSTILAMLSIEEGTELLRRFPGVSAFWTTPSGEPLGEHDAGTLPAVLAR